MKKYSWFILILIFALTPRLWADDTDIYGTSSISVPPNVLIIFDSSGSMSNKDVPGEYYDSATTYSGSYTGSKVYEKVCGWGCSYEEFAGSVDDLNCPDVKTALETNGYKTDASVMDSGGGYVCGGSSKDLYLGNWINYDESGTGGLKTRNEVAKTVIKQLITDTDNVNFGLMRFNFNQGGRIISPIGTDKDTLLSQVDGIPAEDWTPLAETLAEAGLYFAGQTSWYNGSDKKYSSTCDTEGIGCYKYTSPIEYRCQKNYIILITDGEPTYDGDKYSDYTDSKLVGGTYINGDHIGDYDNDGEDPGDYDDHGSDYLDDVAAYLYQNDIDPSLGESGDIFEKQNIITYTIGFRTDNELLAKTAYNGGGLYYTANSISGLTAALQKIMTNIADVNAVFVSPVVPMSKMNQAFAGNSLYLGFFKPQADGHWSGNLKKYGIDDQGNIIDANGNPLTDADSDLIKDSAQSYWSTSPDGSDVLKGGIGALLLDQATRHLYTVINPAKTLTDPENAFSVSNASITTSTLDVTTSTDRDSVINDINGVGKDWKLGDILHSKPSVVTYDTNNNDKIDAGDDSYIYVGTNDGIMHSFKDSDGSEAWGFIPPDLLPRLKELSDGSTDHKYFVDGSPKVFEDDSLHRKILIFGERRGGNQYHALDVTDYNLPTYLYAIGPTILTNIDHDGDGNIEGPVATLGQSWSQPMIHRIKTPSPEYVFLMAGGYDTNQDKDPNDPVDPRAAVDTYGKAVFTVNDFTGAVSSLDFNAGNFPDMKNSIVDVSGFETKFDSTGKTYLNRVYAGDLGGNVFAFEDDNGDGTWSKRWFFSASAVDGVQRKIFYGPDAVEEMYGEIIYFGTGDRANPKNTGVVNRVYAIKNSWVPLDDFSTLTESDLYDATQDLIVLGNGDQQTAAKEALLNGDGWFIKLDQHPGEKVTSPMLVYDGVVYFTTYTPDTGPPPEDKCAQISNYGVARLYALDYATGEAAYDWSDAVEQDDTPDHNIVKKGRSDRSIDIGTSIASAMVIGVFRDQPVGLVATGKKVKKQKIKDSKYLRTFFWRQMSN